MKIKVLGNDNLEFKKANEACERMYQLYGILDKNCSFCGVPDKYIAIFKNGDALATLGLKFKTTYRTTLPIERVTNISLPGNAVELGRLFVRQPRLTLGEMLLLEALPLTHDFPVFCLTHDDVKRLFEEIVGDRLFIRQEAGIIIENVPTQSRCFFDRKEASLYQIDKEAAKKFCLSRKAA